jgi:hypothetical protein
MPRSQLTSHLDLCFVPSNWSTRIEFLGDLKKTKGGSIASFQKKWNQRGEYYLFSEKNWKTKGGSIASFQKKLWRGAFQTTSCITFFPIHWNIANSLSKHFTTLSGSARNVCSCEQTGPIFVLN